MLYIKMPNVRIINYFGDRKTKKFCYFSKLNNKNQEI